MSKFVNDKRRQELLRPRQTLKLSRLSRLLGLRLLRHRSGLRHGLRIRSSGGIWIAEWVPAGAGTVRSSVRRTENRADGLADVTILRPQPQLLLRRVHLIFQRIPNEFPVLIFFRALVQLH